MFQKHVLNFIISVFCNSLKKLFEYYRVKHIWMNQAHKLVLRVRWVSNPTTIRLQKETVVYN